MDLQNISQRSGAEMPSSFCMTDIAAKPVSQRIAVAQGSIRVSPKTFSLILTRCLPKGDCLALAEISGILAAKSTPTILPLCHPLVLDTIKVSCHPDPELPGIIVSCMVKSTGKTGVEMEALAGVQGALLCIYDLCKPVDKAMEMHNIRLCEKYGGQSGDYLAEGAGRSCQLSAEAEILRPWHKLRCCLLSVSDRASRGEYEDISGRNLFEGVIRRGGVVEATDLVADSPALIKERLEDWVHHTGPDIILITGGTGASARDCTPETVGAMLETVVPGIGELLRSEGARFNSRAWLSRSCGGFIKQTLLVTLPGSVNAVRESLSILEPLIPHLLQVRKDASGAHPDSGKGDRLLSNGKADLS